MSLTNSDSKSASIAESIMNGSFTPKKITESSTFSNDFNKASLIMNEDRKNEIAIGRQLKKELTPQELSKIKDHAHKFQYRQLAELLRKHGRNAEAKHIDTLITAISKNPALRAISEAY